MVGDACLSGCCGRSMRRCARCSPSGRDGSGRPRSRARSATEASPPWPARPGSRRPRSAVAWQNWRPTRPCRPTGCAGPVGDGSGRPPTTRRCCTIWRHWSNRPPGDPESPLRWTCLSTRTLATALEALGHSASHTVVAELLHGLGYSLQGNVKTREGRQHPDRDAQFRYIARQVRAAQAPPAADDLGATRSDAGLHVRAELDRGRNPAGVVVTDAQMVRFRLKPHRFHGGWTTPFTPPRHNQFLQLFPDQPLVSFVLPCS